jgi:hypothetical protein
MFDDNLYIVVMISAIFLIIIYGHPNNTSDYIIEYDDKQFKYLEKIHLVDKQIEKNIDGKHNIQIKQFGSIEEITSKMNNCEKYIPNIVSVYNIMLNPNTLFPTEKYINSTQIMLIKINNIEPNKIALLIKANYECDNNSCGNYGYFYNLDKKKSIVNIYPIINNSDIPADLTIYTIKKPFWYV